MFALSAPASGSALDDMLRLIGIAAIVLAFFKGIKLLIAKPAEKPARGRPSPAPPSRDGEVTPEIIVAIAAAISTVAGKSQRIISIKPMSTSWEKAGRQSVLSSHRIR